VLVAVAVAQRGEMRLREQRLAAQVLMQLQAEPRVLARGKQQKVEVGTTVTATVSALRQGLQQ
jgi:hypothetical protein